MTLSVLRRISLFYPEGSVIGSRTSKVLIAYIFVGQRNSIAICESEFLIAILRYFNVINGGLESLIIAFEKGHFYQ